MLDKDQQLAVDVMGKRMLIQAGAGSGKTRVLIAKTEKLLETYDSTQIVLITFTRKSADEMTNRLQNPDIACGTFHSLAAKLIQTKPNIILPDNCIIIIEEALAKIKASRFEEDLPAPTAEWIYEAYAKSIETMSPLSFGRWQDRKSLIEETLELYKQNKQGYDYQDLLVAWLDEAPGNFKIALVDEAQDLNKLQRSIIEKFEFVVEAGDSEQAIYSWRGADYQDFLDSERDQTVSLVNNYRSTKSIVELSQIISHSKDQYVSQRDQGDKVRIHHANTHSLANSIKDWVREFDTDNLAVLARDNETLEKLAKQLNQMGVQASTNKPSKAQLEAKKFMMSLMDLGLNPDSRVGWLALSNLAGIDPEDREEFLQTKDRSFLEDHPAGKTIQAAIQEANRENWFALAHLLEERSFLLEIGNQDHTGAEFLERVQDAEIQREGLQLSTIHAAKGLEWKHVALIPNLKEGDEERRLLYVALTRAEDSLTIFEDESEPCVLLDPLRHLLDAGQNPNQDA